MEIPGKIVKFASLVSLSGRKLDLNQPLCLSQLLCLAHMGSLGPLLEGQEGRQT